MYSNGLQKTVDDDDKMHKNPIELLTELIVLYVKGE